MRPHQSPSLQQKVARETANLIYHGIEKEYKQAKLKAAKTLGVNFLPTNLEVAKALDEIAQEKEGARRTERLIQMRRHALQLMKIVEDYNPVLVGSVWRGTAHHGSDIDIAIYHNDPDKILETTKQNNLTVTQTEWTTVTNRGIKKTSFHIHLKLQTDEEAELVVRNPTEADHQQRCEIYGDLITGLHIQELEKILQENPDQKFVPYQ